MALFGVEDGDDDELIGLDHGDKVISAETVGVFQALRDRRAVALPLLRLPSRWLLSLLQPLLRQVLFQCPPLATLLGMATGGAALQGMEFIDSLPPAQLLTVGGMFCPSLQAAGTLVDRNQGAYVCVWDAVGAVLVY